MKYDDHHTRTGVAALFFVVVFTTTNHQAIERK